MSAEKLLRPVVDPSLPADERDLLAESSEGLVAAGDEVPKRGGRTGADAWWALGIATACGFAPAATLPWLLGGIGAILGVLAQVGSALLWWRFGFGAFLGAGTALQVVAWIVLYACSGDGARERLGREHHGRYFLEDDLGGTVQDVVRAQKAVDKVSGSALAEAGMLPAVDLRALEWEIAVACREATTEKRTLRKMAKANRGDEELRLSLQPRWRAVNAVLREMRARVAALDRYATRVSTAGVFHRAVQRGDESDERLRSALAEAGELAAALAARPAGGEART
ncbi:hypothetical protein [Actinomadura sp. WMMB 499]|uniref:hypothetical protein n=1 Tax=Actinomadura sp. WMMB 499 TaxID=1219491 RepID=UPI0012466298|nr:hypothetical protein [Actinomadura sp. WMMB 499]QFG23064.1 hypothetical protein F7P10_19995 [Actinomadura sp. WMMB 499]